MRVLKDKCAVVHICKGLLMALCVYFKLLMPPLSDLGCGSLRSLGLLNQYLSSFVYSSSEAQSFLGAFRM